MPQTNTEQYIELIRKMDRAMHSDNIVSLYVKNGRFYLSNRFFEQLCTASGVTLEILSDGSIILKEAERKKKISQHLQSKKVSQWICNQYGIQENAKLAFFPLKEAGHWKGQLIPQIRHSYGWDRMEQYTEVENNITWADNALLCRLQRYYYQVIERDEIQRIYKWGAALAETTYDGGDGDFWHYKLICIVSLLKELAVCQRKVCEKQGIVEFDSRLHTYSEGQNSFGEPWESYSGVVDRMMIEKFKTLLTDQELSVLLFLCRSGNLGETVSLGRETKKWMRKAHMALKQKACKYWGGDYINSFFTADVACY